MRYIRTTIWFIYFFLYLIFVLPKTSKLKKLTEQGKIQERDAYLRKTVYKWATRLMRLAGVKVNITGKENLPDGPALFVSNHQGLYDIPVLLTSLDKPNGFIAKKEAKKIPFVPTWMDYLGCVFIDRENPREAVKALNEAADKIKSGYSIIIFPEGTRSKSDNMGPFKGGAFKIAEKTRVPIVPVLLDGTYKIMEANKNWMVPGTVNVTILPPIDTTELTKADFKTLGPEIKASLENTFTENHK